MLAVNVSNTVAARWTVSLLFSSCSDWEDKHQVQTAVVWRQRQDAAGTVTQHGAVSQA